jgi:branched-chain amino acid transport system permease protein
VEQFLQALINGIMLGGLYAVMVLGFSIFWGTTGIINLAHGEFLMMGAYLTWIMNRRFGWEPFAALIVVIPVMFVVGYALQRILINRIIDRPQLVSLLVTFGLSIILANVFKLLFTATPRSVDTILSGFWRLGNVTIPVVKTYNLFAAVLMMAGLTTLLKYSRLGKSIRAASQNRDAARMVGIRISSVYALTFAVCIALTGAAGVLVSPTQAIWPFMGPAFTLKAFAITTMAGLSSIPGALLGSLGLGLIEVYVATYVPGVGTNLGIVASFVILVVALATRPQGLFGGLKATEAQ